VAHCQRRARLTGTHPQRARHVLAHPVAAHPLNRVDTIAARVTGMPGDRGQRPLPRGVQRRDLPAQRHQQIDPPRVGQPLRVHRRQRRRPVRTGHPDSQRRRDVIRALERVQQAGRWRLVQPLRRLPIRQSVLEHVSDSTDADK
jgi:hypothetical protein